MPSCTLIYFILSFLPVVVNQLYRDIHATMSSPVLAHELKTLHDSKQHFCRYHLPALNTDSLCLLQGVRQKNICNLNKARFCECSMKLTRFIWDSYWHYLELEFLLCFIFKKFIFIKCQGKKSTLLIKSQSLLYLSLVLLLLELLPVEAVRVRLLLDSPPPSFLMLAMCSDELVLFTVLRKYK